MSEEGLPRRQEQLLTPETLGLVFKEFDAVLPPELAQRLYDAGQNGLSNLPEGIIFDESYEEFGYRQKFYSLQLTTNNNDSVMLGVAAVRQGERVVSGKTYLRVLAYTGPIDPQGVAKETRFLLNPEIPSIHSSSDLSDEEGIPQSVEKFLREADVHDATLAATVKAASEEECKFIIKILAACKGKDFYKR